MDVLQRRAQYVGVCAAQYPAPNELLWRRTAAGGRNLGAGMSNGIAYVLDEHGHFASKLNPELVAIKRVTVAEDIEIVQALIERHVQLTESARGREILGDWERFRPLFWKVAPHSAMSAEGPQTIIRRHLESLRAVSTLS